VVAECAREQHHIAGATVRPREVEAHGQHAHAGGVHVDTVAVTALDHLGVAGDDTHARFGGRVVHRDDDAPELLDRHPLFQHEAHREVERRCARGRHVVHRAADRQPADVAAREEQRMHHVGVGGKRETTGGEVERGGVVHPTQHLVTELGHEELLDELLHHGAAATVGEQDAVGSHGSGLRSGRGALTPCRSRCSGSMRRTSPRSTPCTGRSDARACTPCRRACTRTAAPRRGARRRTGSP